MNEKGNNRQKEDAPTPKVVFDALIYNIMSRHGVFLQNKCAPSRHVVETLAQKVKLLVNIIFAGRTL